MVEHNCWGQPTEYGNIVPIVDRPGGDCHHVVVPGGGPLPTGGDKFHVSAHFEKRKGV